MARNPQFALAFGLLPLLFLTVGAAAAAQEDSCKTTVPEDGGAIGTEPPKSILLQHAVGAPEKVVQDAPLPMMLPGGKNSITRKSANSSLVQRSSDLGMGLLVAGPTEPVNYVVYPNGGAIPGEFTAIFTTSIEGQKSASIHITAPRKIESEGEQSTPITMQKFNLHGINPDEPLYHPRIEVVMTMSFGADGDVPLGVKARVLPDGEWASADPIPMSEWSDPQHEGEVGVCPGVEMLNEMICKDGSIKTFVDKEESADACIAKCQGEADKPARWCCVWNDVSTTCRFHTDDFVYEAPGLQTTKWYAGHCER